eukprot:g11133.t1
MPGNQRRDFRANVPTLLMLLLLVELELDNGKLQGPRPRISSWGRLAEAKETEKAPQSAFVLQESHFHQVAGNRDVQPGETYHGNVGRGYVVGAGATVFGNVTHSQVDDHATVHGNTMEFANVGEFATIHGNMASGNLDDSIVTGDFGGGNVFGACIGGDMGFGNLREALVMGNVGIAHVGPGAKVMGSVGLRSPSTVSGIDLDHTWTQYNKIDGVVVVYATSAKSKSTIERGAVIMGNVRNAHVKAGATVYGDAICCDVDRDDDVRGAITSKPCSGEYKFESTAPRKKCVRAKPARAPAPAPTGNRHPRNQHPRNQHEGRKSRRQSGRAHRRDEEGKERIADKEEKDSSSTIAQSVDATNIIVTANATNTTVTEEDSSPAPDGEGIKVIKGGTHKGHEDTTSMCCGS